MSLLPAAPSPDIVRLRNEGYEVEIRGAYLLVSHVPYVDSNRTIQYGVLVSTVQIAADKVVGPPPDHVAHFAGSAPCHKDGTIMKQIQHPGALPSTLLGADIPVQRWFSHKPLSGYPDYYSKMTRYIEVISAPASSLDQSVTAQTFTAVPGAPRGVGVPLSGHQFQPRRHRRDHQQAQRVQGRHRWARRHRLLRARLGVEGHRPTRSIFTTATNSPSTMPSAHPARPSLDQLRTPPKKVAYWTEIYSRMRRGIFAHAEFIDGSNVGMLRGLDFVFICVDDGRAKRAVVEALEARLVPFIDVGMGVQIVDGQLLGMLRTTVSTPEKTRPLPQAGFLRSGASR